MPLFPPYFKMNHGKKKTFELKGNQDMMIKEHKLQSHTDLGFNPSAFQLGNI